MFLPDVCQGQKQIAQRIQCKVKAPPSALPTVSILRY